MKLPNGNELSSYAAGMYQSPIDVLTEFNKWEYVEFDLNAQAEELRQELGFDFVCIGNSKYESVARAVTFYKKGLVQGTKIFPLGLLEKRTIYDVIKKTGLKLHPSYKLSQSTLDYPSYYKMRSTFIAQPEYRKKMMAAYPLLRLDEYRYEVLFGHRRRYHQSRTETSKEKTKTERKRI